MLRCPPYLHLVFSLYLLLLLSNFVNMKFFSNCEPGNKSYIHLLKGVNACFIIRCFKSDKQLIYPTVHPYIPVV